MSIEMEQAADAILQAAGHISSQDELSEVEIDGDGSSSLSDLEDKDPEQDDDGELSDELSNPSDEEHDSEAETERLEESPNKFRPQKDVVLTQSDGQTYERSPSKLHHQITVDDIGAEDDDPLTDDEISVIESIESPKSSVHDAEVEVPTVPTSLEDSSVESRTLLAVADGDSRKRKRSIMAGGGLDADLGEPLRKRTGSIMTPVDDYAIEDENNPEEDLEQSNANSGNISDDEEPEAQEEDAQEDATAVEDEPELPEAPPSPKRRGRKKKKGAEAQPLNQASQAELTDTNDAGTPNGEETADAEAEDEADAQARNEEELERKRVAFEQLGEIEKHFATLRERLYEERLAQLNKEEAMLRQSKPTHPEYLAMMQCLDQRRDERLRIADKKREFGFETLKVFAVAGRSQILSQYNQEVREAREQHIERLGKQWYEIQHDRRSYAGNVPDYTVKFPVKRSQQIQNQVAYSNEVSILAGISKYIGFPAAPPMLPASIAEIEEDFEKIGRGKLAQQTSSVLPFHELAALRSAGSTSRYRAEEQFIEQTPWANPQHPSHAHRFQRQASGQQVPRTTSPFSSLHVPRQNGPVSGTFSNTSAPLHNPNGRVSPLNPFTNTNTTAPSPLVSRQTSKSPQLNRPPGSEARPTVAQDVPNLIGAQTSLPRPRDFPKEVRRDQATPIMGQF